jgi:3-phosphoshikimate 1-carboxyvinyltransferase
LADGVSHLRGYTPCGDNEAALSLARALGADVQQEGNMLTIKGISASLGALADQSGNCVADGRRTIHVGESGLLARMMIPLMAQLHDGPVEITGEKTLLERPLTGAREILDAVGCSVKCEASDNAVRVPLTVAGPLKGGGRVEISGRHGSQLITGLLMALPFAEKNTTLVVKDPKSIPYIFITLEVLKKFGVRIGNEMLGGRDFLESDGDWSLCSEIVFKVRGGQRLKAVDMDLEADWSAAANFLVAGAVFGKVEIAGLDTTSLQADLSIMDILMDAGASLSQVDGPKGNITVQRAPLRAFSVDASNCPDLFPIISVLAAFCQGTSRIAGLSRLANKESDRGSAILNMLRQMGVDVHRENDELVIRGYSLAQRLLGQQAHGSAGQSAGQSAVHAGGQAFRVPGLLKGGNYKSHHDHRMVMALKVASLGADGPIVIDDEACVQKSFPSFDERFGEIACN